VPRRAARVDDNHHAIVSAMRDCGAKVLSLAPLGYGIPDLLVLTRRYGLRLVEVKDGSKPPSARALTRKQQEFHADWRVVSVVTSVDEAVALCT
jgi:hypothetical protein